MRKPHRTSFVQYLSLRCHRVLARARGTLVELSTLADLHLKASIGKSPEALGDAHGSGDLRYRTDRFLTTASGEPCSISLDRGRLAMPRCGSPMLTRDDILRQLALNRTELARLGALRLGLFGSFARNEARDDSDVDILVEIDRHEFDRYMILKFYLEDMLGREVDLVLSDRLKPALREHILGEVIDAA